MSDLIRNIRVGSVWLMDVPFDNNSESKKRPVIVLSKAITKYGTTYIVVPMYSQFDECEFDTITVSNGTDNNRVSFARVTKMRPAIDTDFVHYIGDLSEEKIVQIRNMMVNFLSGSIHAVEQKDSVVVSEYKSDTEQYTDVSDTNDTTEFATCKRNVLPMWDRYVAMYKDGAITAAQISKELGIKYATIYYRLRREVEKK